LTFYIIALAVLMFGAIAPSFAAPYSLFRAARSLIILAVYPLLLLMAVTHGVRAAGLTWVSLAGFALALELIADALAPGERLSFLRTVRNALLVWPLTIPATTESFLIKLGVVPPHPEVRLPDPPRGDALFGLSDDDMLSAAHEILSGPPTLTAEERTILVAESFNREIHGGGFLQWFSNTDSSVPDTVQSLRDVGAPRTAVLLQRAGDAAAAESMLRSLTDEFFALEREEDLTSLIASFLRQHRSRCPAFETATDV
jgi:hypothetical protein